MEVDPRTPVIVGVGQFTERIDDADYRAMSSVEPGGRGCARRTRRLAAPTWPRSRQCIDIVAGLRQFEICTRVITTPPLGRSDNYPRSVANRVGADPARAVSSPSAAKARRHLITELAGADRGR